MHILLYYRKLIFYTSHYYFYNIIYSHYNYKYFIFLYFIHYLFDQGFNLVSILFDLKFKLNFANILNYFLAFLSVHDFS